MPDAQVTTPRKEESRPALRTEAARAPDRITPMRTAIDLPLKQLRKRSPGTSFVVLAGLLIFLGYAAYQLFWASPLYQTEMRFAVRQADMPRLQAGPSLLGAGMLATITESNAVVQYLRSRDALDGLEALVPLRSMLGREAIDWLSRVPEDASPERLLRRLSRFIRPQFDHTSGIITVQVQAFSAEESLSLARAVEKLAEELVNRMSLGARRGLLAVVEGEAAEADRRLSALRDQLRELREATERLDPRRSATAADELRSRLEVEIAEQRVELARMRRFQAENSPAVQQQRQRIEALEGELRAQIQQAIGSGNAALTSALRRHEALEGEMETAQKSYEAILATLERTRSDANRQQIYLGHIVRPTLPGSFYEFTRWQNIGTAAALGLLGGLLLLLVIRTVREHFV